MSEYKDFSSLPPDKERHFVVFEQTSRETLKKARLIGIICGAVFGVLVLAIAFSHEPPHNKMAEDDMSSLKRSTKSDDAAKTETQPPAAPAAAPATDTPAAPAAEGAAPAAAPAGGEAAAPAAEAKPQ